MDCIACGTEIGDGARKFGVVTRNFRNAPVDLKVAHSGIRTPAALTKIGLPDS